MQTIPPGNAGPGSLAMSPTSPSLFAALPSEIIYRIASFCYPDRTVVTRTAYRQPECELLLLCKQTLPAFRSALWQDCFLHLDELHDTCDVPGPSQPALERQSAAWLGALQRHGDLVRDVRASISLQGQVEGFNLHADLLITLLGRLQELCPHLQSLHLNLTGCPVSLYTTIQLAGFPAINSVSIGPSHSMQGRWMGELDAPAVDLPDLAAGIPSMQHAVVMDRQTVSQAEGEAFGASGLPRFHVVRRGSRFEVASAVMVPRLIDCEAIRLAPALQALRVAGKSVPAEDLIPILHLLPPTILHIDIAMSRSLSFGRFSQLRGLCLREDALSDYAYDTELVKYFCSLPATLVVLAINNNRYPTRDSCFLLVATLQRFLPIRKRLLPQLKWLYLDFEERVADFGGSVAHFNWRQTPTYVASTSLASVCQKRGISLRVSGSDCPSLPDEMPWEHLVEIA